MEKLKELVKRVENTSNDAGAWLDLIAFAENQVEQIYTNELVAKIKEHFGSNLPSTVEIEMDTEHESEHSSYRYLSAVYVDGERDEELLELLGFHFDIQTLDKNPMIEL